METLAKRIDLFTSLRHGSEGAEIGVYRGDFSEQILKTAVATLHLVDCWQCQKGDYEKDPSNINQGGQDANYREVQSKFARYIHSGRVCLYRLFSKAASEEFEPGQLDWVYIDADHTYQGCLQDLIRWAPKVKRGGFLSGHDYADNKYTRAMEFGVVAAVTRFCEDYGWKLVAVTDEDWPSYKLERI